MGYMRHHAIIVSSFSDEAIKTAHQVATGIFPFVSELIPHVMNGGYTFLVPPDNSKEGWEESELGDKRRKEFIEYLNNQRFDDWSTLLSWAEVMYGDEEGEAAIICHDYDREPANAED